MSLRETNLRSKCRSGAGAKGLNGRAASLYGDDSMGVSRKCLLIGLLLALSGTQEAGLFSASAAGSLTASVNVTCPFSITPLAAAAYAWGGNVLLNYSAQAAVPCTVPSSSGYLGMYYASNSALAYKEPMHIGSISYNSATQGSIAFDTADVQGGNYVAFFNLSAFGETVSANQTITLIAPATINLSGVRMGSQVVQDSPLSLSASFTNTGQLASGNFMFYVRITGPSTNALLAYDEPALSPGESENGTIAISGYTQDVGTYNFSAYAAYGNSITRTINGTYAVIVPQLFQSGGLPPTSLSGITVASLPALGIQYAPLYTAITSGTSAAVPMVLQNTGTFVERVSLSVPSEYKNITEMSVSKLVISPGQSLSASLTFMPTQGTAPGIYAIPVNIKATINNSTVNSTQSFVFYVYNSTNAFSGIMNQISLLDNGTIAQGTIQATAYEGLKNATLKTLLPQSIAQSRSDISAYGIPNKISEENGYYVITWYVGNLSAAAGAVAYYEIQDPNPALLGLPIQNMLSESSSVPASSLLKPVSVTIPEFYTNSTNQLGVEVMYTGTGQSDVYFYLTGPAGIPIVNSSRVVVARPNQLLDQRFSVLTNSSTGTLVFYAYVITSGANLTYTLPVRVVPQTSQLSQAQSKSPAALRQEYTYAGGAVLASLFVVFVAMRRGRLRKTRYDKDRAARLVLMRERIKREMDQHG